MLIILSLLDIYYNPSVISKASFRLLKHSGVNKDSYNYCRKWHQFTANLVVGIRNGLNWLLTQNSIVIAIGTSYQLTTIFSRIINGSSKWFKTFIFSNVIKIINCRIITPNHCHNYKKVKSFFVYKNVHCASFQLVLEY